MTRNCSTVSTVTLSMCMFVGIVSVETEQMLFFSFLSRSDLFGYEVDTSSTIEMHNIRSATQCSLHCAESCFMFSYDETLEVCRIYSGLVPSNLQRIGTSSNVKYYVQKACPEGMYHSGTDCLSCPRGKYQNKAGQFKCDTCPTGYYQDELGQISCKLCLNSTHWRYATNGDQTSCRRCWTFYNTYTNGDFANTITTLDTNDPSNCARKCDEIPACKRFTWREGEQKCYLHSTTYYEWGFVYLSVIFRRWC